MEFNIADILTITTERLLTPIGNVYEILNFMTGDNLFTHQLPRAGRICKPELLLQHPQFDTPEFHLEVGLLIEMLESAKDVDCQHLINGWLLKQSQTYGEKLLVKPLETTDWAKINPIDELVDMVGKEKVIVIGN